MLKYFVYAFLLLSVACGKDSNSSGSGTLGSTTTESQTPIDSSPISQTDTQAFMTLVNDHRVSLGLRALVHDEKLARIVTQHSQNMANGSVSFGHTGFATRCSSSRSALGGGNWCGENVASGQKTVQAAYHSWMNSSGHKANIEKANATHTGFGVARSNSGTYYWTQIFLER